jgi:NAD(P)-dependent dehydrogenase (short-subunit alcohol dehydrogenase family)
MTFEGKQAIVTGAGSGIGAALCRALVAVGADVFCTDVDGEAAAHTAVPLGARSARLDVTDAAAVQSAVDEVADRAGRLDLMFNNAGITWGGDTELLTLDQWNAIIDVNIRGVVHGVAAAYPLMVRQGYGHIVNTASMAGLAAAGQITSYVMSKHAVVGLSLALRSEAAGRSVGVLAVCPTAVETPILDRANSATSWVATSIEWVNAVRSSPLPTTSPATPCGPSSATRHSWCGRGKRGRPGCSRDLLQACCSACRFGSSTGSVRSRRRGCREALTLSRDAPIGAGLYERSVVSFAPTA